MQLGTRFALALLLTIRPLPPRMLPRREFSKNLFRFRQMKALCASRGQRPKSTFPRSPTNSRHSPTPRGPTSAAIVLNAVYGRNPNLPRDWSRLHEGDLKHVPPNIDPSIPRFTQDNVITKGQKTRAQVLGEPLTLNGKQVTDFGYQIRQLDEMLRANGVTTKLTIVDGDKLDEDIRTELVENLQRRGDYVIIAFLREAVGERGGPHVSPLGAYDAESDSFLVLDVNPASTDWVWMPTKTLIKGMRTFDKIENRGYILVAPQ